MSRFSTLVAALTVLLSLTAAWAGKPTVLVINSYHADYPWVVSHNRALREKLEDRVNLVFFCMDTKRTPEEEHQGQAEHAMTMYETVKPQLVVLADDNALRYLGNHIASRGTPVIYLGVNDNPRRYLDDTTNITGVLERPLLKRSIVFLKDIMKDIHKCLLLFDNSTTSHALVEVVFHGRKSVSFAETETDITLATTFAQWEKAVRNARDDGYNAIILGLYQSLKDEDGKHIPATTVARWTSANSPVPMFCFGTLPSARGWRWAAWCWQANPRAKLPQNWSYAS